MADKHVKRGSSGSPDTIKYRACYNNDGEPDSNRLRIASFCSGIISFIFREGRFNSLLEKLSDLKLVELKDVTFSPMIKMLNINISITKHYIDDSDKTDQEDLKKLKARFDDLIDRLQRVNDKGTTIYIDKTSLYKDILPEHAATLEQFRSATEPAENSVLTPEKEIKYKQIMPRIHLITSSDTAWKVMSLPDGSGTPIDKLTAIVEKDPAIAVRLIQYVNSAYSGLNKKAKSLKDAVIHAGFNPLMNIALQVTLMSRKSKKCEGFDYDSFWSESSAAAVSARRISKIFMSNSNPETSFTAGLLHRVGELAYASTFPREYSDYLIQKKEGSEKTMTEMYPDRLPLTESELAARLIQEWKLPESMALAVLHLHGNERLSDNPDVAKLTGILEWSSRIARLMNSPILNRRAEIEPIIQDLIAKLMIGEKLFGDIFNDITEDWQQCGSIFGIRTKPVPLWPDILR